MWEIIFRQLKDNFILLLYWKNDIFLWFYTSLIVFIITHTLLSLHKISVKAHRIYLSSSFHWSSHNNFDEMYCNATGNLSNPN